MADWTPPERQIVTLAEQSFPQDNPSHRLVTFLNKTLKSHGYIFGLSRDQEGNEVWTIYQLIETGDED
ncbi:MAG: DUF4264 family protein [Firmicutes bacterium]|jgi:hypothetical protein|nr:DUF4264 family protein [Bacillota bacterium]